MLLLLRIKGMLLEEKLSRMREEEALRDNLNNSMKVIFWMNIHPGIDKRAKWELKNLFSTSLGVPNYLL